MAHFTVVSRTHSLFPLAYRLRGEGHEVDLHVWDGRFSRAWRAALAPQSLERLSDDGEWETHSRQLARVISQAEGGSCLVSDLPELWVPSGNVPHRYVAPSQPAPAASLLKVGGWWTGDKLLTPHVLVEDRGAWPGGLGTTTPGGLTLVNTPVLGGLEGLWRSALTQLGGLKYQGLFQCPVLPTAEGGIYLGPPEGGWPFLHSHAFLSELDGLGEVLLGQQEPTLPKRFVVALPLSVPPYPTQRAWGGEPRPIGGLTPVQRQRVFWHDVQPMEGALTTGALDGLVGVVRGAAGNLELARQLALEVCERVELAEKQYRPDVAQHVDRVLAGVEQSYGVVL